MIFLEFTPSVEDSQVLDRHRRVILTSVSKKAW